MAGSFFPTGSYSNLTRIQLEQVRKADFFSGSKALTVGDSNVNNDGTSFVAVGIGNINAEQFFTQQSTLLDDVYSLTPSPVPGLGLTTISQVGSDAVVSETTQWYGPTNISVGVNIGHGLTNVRFKAGLTGNFTNVLPGDILLIKATTSSGSIDLNGGVSAIVQSVTTTTFTADTLILSTITNPNYGTVTTPGTLLDHTHLTPYAYLVVRPNAVKLFAYPGSGPGPGGQEQTFLTVKPTSTLHSASAPSTGQINADRILNIIPPSYNLNNPNPLNPSVDAADSVFGLSGPLQPLGPGLVYLAGLGYRWVVYPDTGSGTPDLAHPITSSSVINPGIASTDQRFTFDYKEGIFRLSCAPALGGAFKVAGGTGPAGRLQLWAVFWAVDTTNTRGAARSLYGLQSTNNAALTPGTITYSAGAWQVNGGLNVATGGLTVNNNVTINPDTTSSATIANPLVTYPAPGGGFQGSVTGLWTFNNGNIGVRAYAANLNNYSQFQLTHNARWDGTQWVADGYGGAEQNSSVLFIDRGGLAFRSHTSGGPSNPFSAFENNLFTVAVGGGVTIGLGGLNVTGGTTTDKLTVTGVGAAWNVPLIQQITATSGGLVAPTMVRQFASGSMYVREYESNPFGNDPEYFLTNNAYWNGSSPAGTFTVSASTSVATSADQTGSMVAGYVIEFASQPGVWYTVTTPITSSTIHLTTPYTGTPGTTTAVYAMWSVDANYKPATAIFLGYGGFSVLGVDTDQYLGGASFASWPNTPFSASGQHGSSCYIQIGGNRKEGDIYPGSGGCTLDLNVTNAMVVNSPGGSGTFTMTIANTATGSASNRGMWVQEFWVRFRQTSAVLQFIAFACDNGTTTQFEPGTLDNQLGSWFTGGVATDLYHGRVIDGICYVEVQRFPGV